MTATAPEIAFPTVPDWVPEADGFWGPAGSWTAWDGRREWAANRLPDDRVRRLVAVAFARRALPAFEAGRPEDGRPRTAVDTAEWYADLKRPTKKSRARLRAARDGAWATATAFAAAAAATAFAAIAFAATAFAATATAAAAAATAAAATDAERRNQSRLLSLYVAADWGPVRSADVCALAAGIYADKGWDRLPILADAMDEAGAEPYWTTDLMRHSPHLFGRGAWVLDVLTGRR